MQTLNGANRLNADSLDRLGRLQGLRPHLTFEQLQDGFMLDYLGIQETYRAIHLGRYCRDVERLPSLVNFRLNSQAWLSSQTKLFILEVTDPHNHLSESYNSTVLYFTRNGFELTKEAVQRNVPTTSETYSWGLFGFTFRRFSTDAFHWLAIADVKTDDIMINLMKQISCNCIDGMPQNVRDELLAHRATFNKQN